MPFGAPVTSPVLDQAQSQLNTAQMSHAQIQQELQNLMQYRATTPMSVIEGQQRDQEMSDLQVRLTQMEDEMRGLRDTITRQQATIRNQSAAISNPRQFYPAPNTTPGGFVDIQSQGPMHGHHASMQMPPPPPPFFNHGTPIHVQQTNQPPPHMRSIHDQNPHTGNTQSQQWNTPMNQQPGVQGQPLHQTPFHPHGPTSVNQFGSPEARPPFNTNIGPYGTPNDRSQGSSNPTSGQRSGQGTPGHALMQQPDNSMALVPAPAVIENPTTVKDQCELVFGMAEKFGWSHVNFPSSHKDKLIPQAIKDRLLQTAAPAQAFPLMTSPATRFLLVAKVINQWVQRNVLKADSFRGFDTECDTNIDRNRNQIYQSTPAQVKYQLLNNIAAQMQVMKQKPGFGTFVDNLARSRGNELWKIVQPLMHVKTSRDWEDMHWLMNEAHNLAIMMYSGPDQYRFETPQAGQFFKSGDMVPKDPYPNIATHEQLEARGVRVKLGISPHVIVKTSTPLGLVSESTVVRAVVLLDATWK